tara:strand:+ start:19610 stop:20524 length:915 start_codon:yes stop_codon:yes gene_type:complete
MELPTQKPLRILVTGASGLVGRAVSESLSAQGHTVIPLSHTKRPDTFHWNPIALTIDTEALENLDAVIHLAGEPVFGWWSSYKKKQIALTRIQGTRFLCEQLLQCKVRPKVFIAASASGYYGPGPFTDPLTESSPQGDGFLAHVCSDWEAAAIPLEEAGTRVIQFRFGTVLGAGGGVLAKMVPLFQRAFPVCVGRKKQRVCWVALDDVVRMVHYGLVDEAWSGPINAVAPQPVTNSMFARTLASVLGKRVWMRVPSWLLRMLIGEMARELLLADHPLKPQKLSDLGFTYVYPELQGALKHALED